MSVSSVLFTVHFEWATNLGPKMFSTLKLNQLQCHKTRLRQPLSGATIMLFVERSDDIEPNAVLSCPGGRWRHSKHAGELHLAPAAAGRGLPPRVPHVHLAGDLDEGGSLLLPLTLSLTHHPHTLTPSPLHMHTTDSAWLFFSICFVSPSVFIVGWLVCVYTCSNASCDNYF